MKKLTTRTYTRLQELESNALHSLLKDNGGLTERDVAYELKLDAGAAEALLVEEQRRGLVDLRVEDSVYISLLRINTIPSDIARADLEVARKQLAATRAIRRIVLAASGVIIAALAVIVIASSLGTSAPPATSMKTEPTFSRRAAAFQKRMTSELAAEQKQLATLEVGVKAANCESKWTDGKACYVTSRAMSREDVDVERERLRGDIARLESELRR